MKLIKNKKYLQQKFLRKVLVSQTTANFTSRDSKSYVPFTCKFPMVVHFVLIRHMCCRSKTNCYVFSYDKTNLKFCSSFRFFLAIFMEKIQKNPLSELCEKENRTRYIHASRRNEEAMNSNAFITSPLWLIVGFIRRILDLFLNVCPFDYTAFVACLDSVNRFNHTSLRSVFTPTDRP